MLIFAYGTLMSGLPNHKVMSEPEFKGIAVTAEKYSLFAKGVPYAQKNPQYQIYGELYELNNLDRSRVDSLEGHPVHWIREKIDVINDEGEKIKAYMYFNENSPLNVHEITSGNYRDYVNKIYTNQV